MGAIDKATTDVMEINTDQVKKQIQELERTRLKLTTLSKTLHTQNAALVKAWSGEGRNEFLNTSVSQENAISNHIKAIENLMVGMAGIVAGTEDVDESMGSLLEQVSAETEAMNNGL